MFQPTSSVADGVVGDGHDLLDGVPDFVMTGPFTFFTSLQDTPHTPEDGRAVVEFDTAALMGVPQGHIVGATLTLTEYGTAPDGFNLYGYEGNGFVDLSDFLQTSDLLGSGTTQNASAVGRTLLFDVTEFVQVHAVSHLGFLLVNTSLNSPTSNGECCGFSRFVSFDDLGAPFPQAEFITLAHLPTLTIEVVPEPVPEPIPLDIKPRKCPNPLNVKSHSMLPVAIVGTFEFDVSEVDVASLRLEGVAPRRSGIEDVATPFESFDGLDDALDCTKEGPDGLDDLTLKFSTQDVVAALGAVSDGDELILELTGSLTDGTSILGEDVVVILTH